jgi:hypothetical protein
MGGVEDGLWRDANGNLASHSVGPDAGHLAWIKGVVGMAGKLSGKGGN